MFKKCKINKIKRIEKCLINKNSTQIKIRKISKEAKQQQPNTRIGVRLTRVFSRGCLTNTENFIY